MQEQTTYMYWCTTIHSIKGKSSRSVSIAKGSSFNDRLKFSNLARGNPWMGDRSYMYSIGMRDFCDKWKQQT